MTNPAPQDPADEAPDPSVLRAERLIGLLQRVEEIVLEQLVRTVEPGGAVAEADPAKGKDPAEAIGILTRAIRLTATLEHKIDADLRDLKAGIVREKKEERRLEAEWRKFAAAQDAQEREEKVRDLVMEAADREIGDLEAYNELYEALEERLCIDEGYNDLLERPVGETVERLCKDLKLNFDQRLWDGEKWIRPGGLRPRPLWSEFNQPSAKPYDPAPKPQLE